MTYPLLFSLAIRSFVPPLLALLVIAAWRRSSASSRRMVWVMCFVALTLLPLALIKLPTATVVDNSPAASSEPAQMQSLSNPVGPDQAISNPAATPLPAQNPTSSLDLAEGFTLLWTIGALLVLAHWLMGLIRLSTLQLQAVTDEAMISELETACCSIGLKRIPRLATCAEVTAPMVFGQFHPCLVLPAEARNWSGDTLQATFLHECAHIERGDWLGLMVSRVLTALYWFNPLAWFAANEFRAECEASADDAVLLSGFSPSSYAAELLRVAMEVRPPAIANSLTLLEVHLLKKRIERVLERNRTRHSVSRSAMLFCLILSLGLTAGLSFSYQVITKLVSNDGRADLGQGKYVRIIAIAKRTASGVQAWNMRGEILPNSIPLPYGPQEDTTALYVVFAKNVNGGLAIEEPGRRNLIGARSLNAVMSSQAGLGYGVQRIDGASLAVAAVNAAGPDLKELRCRVWNEQQMSPLPSKSGREVVFENVPLRPTGPVATSPELEVPVLDAPKDTNEVGALVGIYDLSHPEWGFWRPDGSPLPAISGVEVRRMGMGGQPIGSVNRQMGLLFRSREGSSGWVGCGDVSGVLLCSGINHLHTPSGRYDLNMVFIDPSLTTMTVVSKAPAADRLVAHLKLAPVSPGADSEKVRTFFFSGGGLREPHFRFDKSLVPPGVGTMQSFQFLYADGSIDSHVDVRTDWEDGVVAIRTEHPEKIAAANLLEHGYKYFNCGNVVLFPSRRP